MDENSSNPPDSGASPVGAFSAGQVFGGGRFQLVSQLGRGGMGVVWLARDLRLDELLALKFLPPEIGHDAAALDDMRREVLKSRKLTHANIIRIHDFHEFPGEPPFISMEYVDGKDLNTLRVERAGRVFTWDEIAPLVAQLCDALDYAHRERVVHRDLKPGNMMLDGRGRLKLADFGIAATIADSTSRTSVRSLSGGTLVYMSPQQMDGELPQPSDDLYAFGATIYELLTGHPPFHTGDIAHQVRHLPAKPLAEKLAELGVSNEIPGPVATMVLACLAKEPAQRPSSACAAAEWAGLKPITAGSEAAVTLATPPRRKAKPLALVGAVTAAVLLLGAGGWWLTHRESELLEEDSSTPGTLATAPQTRALAPGSPGSVDTSFDTRTAEFRGVRAMALQPDGKILVAGNLNFSGPQPRDIRRLNPDGTPDPTFTPARASRELYVLIVEPDGRILLAGDFETINGVKRSRVARLEADGQLSPTFRVPVENGLVHSMARQSDGKVLLGGTFNRIGQRFANGIARVGTNGAVETTFKPNQIPGKIEIRTIVALPDGRILVGGWRVSSVDGGPPGGIVARLLPDGSLDQSFSHGTRPDRGVYAMAVQPDGKILISGAFNTVDGVDRRRFARLLPDGRLDERFSGGGEGASPAIRSVAVQTDGKAIIAHKFTSVQNTARNGIARFDGDGKLDRTFDPGGGPDGLIYQLALQPDGKILVAGEFTNFNGTLANGLVRLHGTSAPAARAAAPKVVPTYAPTNATATVTSPRPATIVAWLRLFDGVSLNGWDADPRYWSVKDGAILGQFQGAAETTPPTPLIWRGTLAKDFELRLKVRYHRGNSGVIYRAKDLGNKSLAGYQYDLFSDRIGNLLDTGSDRPRRDLHRVSPADHAAHVKPALAGGAWTELTIRAEGTVLRHYFNRRLLAEVNDSGARQIEPGLLAFELTGNAPTQIEFKDILLQPLTSATPGAK